MRLIGLLGLAGLSFGLTIYPIPVEVKGRVGYLYIEGQEGRTFKITSEPFEEGEQDNLIVYPPQVRLRNGKSVIKVAFKNTDTSKEQAGRVILTELKPQSEGLSIAYSFSVPVFQPPRKEVFEVEVECMKDRMVVKNKGNIHIKITSLDDKPVLHYVLPNKQIEVQRAKVIETQRGKVNACF